MSAVNQTETPTESICDHGYISLSMFSNCITAVYTTVHYTFSTDKGEDDECRYFLSPLSDICFFPFSIFIHYSNHRIINILSCFIYFYYDNDILKHGR